MTDPLSPDSRPESPTRPTRRSRRRGSGGPGRGPLVALLGVVIVVAGVWWALSRTPESTLQPVGPGAPVGADERVLEGDPAADPPGARVATEPFPELPSLEESDPWVRDRAADLSRDPQWLDWLAADGLVRRMVIAVANVAGGESPSEQLPFLEPSDTFRVVVSDGRAFADPANGGRYDGLVRALTSLDARATARFYRGIGPLVDAAWRPLGFVDRDFDDIAGEALGVVLDAEAPTGPVEVVEEGVVWVYADPGLESLSPATKHLMRIGPDNLLRLQDWVRTFSEAAGIGR